MSHDKNIIYIKVFGFLCRECLLSQREQDNPKEKQSLRKNKKIKSLYMCHFENRVNLLKQSFVSPEPMS